MFPSFSASAPPPPPPPPIFSQRPGPAATPRHITYTAIGQIDSRTESLYLILNSWSQGCYRYTFFIYPYAYADDLNIINRRVNPPLHRTTPEPFIHHLSPSQLRRGTCEKHYLRSLPPLPLPALPLSSTPLQPPACCKCCNYCERGRGRATGPGASARENASRGKKSSLRSFFRSGAQLRAPRPPDFLLFLPPT